MIQIVGQAIMLLVPMILSLTVHEFSHAFAAKRLGDLTAEAHGRLTLNPLPHIDPVGTIGLPLLILLTSGAMGAGIPFFGWAKPVPTNPALYTRKVTVRSGMMIVAAAGPLSNLVMAVLSAGIFSLLIHLGVALQPPIQTFLGLMIQINVMLFIFNLIPVYPLDGQKVLSGFLPARDAMAFERFSHQYGWMLLIALIMFGGSFIAGPIDFLIHGVLRIVGLS